MFARLAGVWSHAESLNQRGRNRGFFLPRIWFLGLPLLVELFLWRANPSLILIAILAIPRLWSAFENKDVRDTD